MEETNEDIIKYHPVIRTNDAMKLLDLFIKRRTFADNIFLK